MRARLREIAPEEKPGRWRLHRRHTLQWANSRDSRRGETRRQARRIRLTQTQRRLKSQPVRARQSDFETAPASAFRPRRGSRQLTGKELHAGNAARERSAGPALVPDVRAIEMRVLG